MKKGTVIYIHGFASAGEGPKVKSLREAFDGVEIISPTLPVNPAEVEAMLDGIIRSVTVYPIVLVGTSLGGFWAHYMAQKWDIPCVLVNPSTKPSSTLSAAVGKSIANYATGMPVIVTPDDITQFAAREDSLLDIGGSLVTLFLARDDDTLDYRLALNYFAFTATTIVKNDGGHRFEKYWPEVILAIENLLS